MARPIIASADIASLREALRSYAPVPTEEFDKLLCLVRPMRIGKSEFLVRAGEIRSNVDFIVSGVIRCYNIEESGLEYTKHFFTDGDFVVVDRGFLFGDAKAPEEAECFFEALVDSTILTVSRQELECSSCPSMLEAGLFERNHPPARSGTSEDRTAPDSGRRNTVSIFPPRVSWSREKDTTASYRFLSGD